MVLRTKTSRQIHSKLCKKDNKHNIIRYMVEWLLNSSFSLINKQSLRFRCKQQPQYNKNKKRSLTFSREKGLSTTREMMTIRMGLWIQMKIINITVEIIIHKLIPTQSKQMLKLINSLKMTLLFKIEHQIMRIKINLESL